ncbi:AAA-like domain-containing protein [bacterium]|nr:AAA-like domain-containing protein [bacterium]NUN46056.1 AAA-like domain-containing protein [bacterium]
MKEKVLKKYTKIPPHLYVERNADLQLKNIIEEMQRPGYVLVARQMGKTNLLFHAKGTLENEKRLFAYIDLSNLYDNEVDCYRNIINIIVESNLGVIGNIENDIDQIRRKSLSPHSEYYRCLKLILNKINCELVIILDEIDALKSISYSDNIFAQIRSTYFSRTNFPEFERLTYVLSGVVEPTELIKDKNKSPFNIGEKIYLDDFTKSEHDDFISKSGLQISTLISNEIYKWANGNPRLTFDICSDVESLVIEGRSVTVDLIEDLIKKKYLTFFDVSPIDHIRELIKNNKQLKNALIALRKGRPEEFTDEIKSKLYLFGIISSNFEGEIRIKNKIIEESLSEEWLTSIKDNTHIDGLIKYSNESYHEAIEIFESVDQDSLSNTDLESNRYFLGLSYFNVKNYKKAMQILSDGFSEEPFVLDYKPYLGVCKIAVGEKNEGISILEEYIKGENHNRAYHIGLLNLAISIDDQNQALNLLEKLFSSTYKASGEKKEYLNKIRSLSLYYQAVIYKKKEDVESALEQINKALEFCNVSDSLFLKYQKYVISQQTDVSIKDDIFKTILSSSILKIESDSHPIGFNKNNLLLYLELAFDKDNLDNFSLLLDYSNKNFLKDITKPEIIYSISKLSKLKRNEILKYLVNNLDETNETLLYKATKEICLIDLANLTDNVHFNKYVELFSGNAFIDPSDIYLFAVAIKSLSDSSEINKALSIAKIIELKLKETIDDETKFESLIIYYWMSNLYFSLRDGKKSMLYADHALELLENSSRKKTSVIDEKGIQTIKNQLLQIKNSHEIFMLLLTSKKFGRNDIVEVKYPDGRIEKKKYKYVEADVLAKKCEIV